jgi:hypothetical protein
MPPRLTPTPRQGLGRSEVLRGTVPGRTLCRGRWRRSPRCRPTTEHHTSEGRNESPMAELYKLPSADEETLTAQNASRDDWISRNGRQRREQKGVFYRRKADFLASKTDPDSSLMKRRESKGSHLGYYDEDHPQCPGHPVRGHREPADARPALAHQLPVEAPPEAGNGGHRLRYYREHRRRGAGRHPRLRPANRSGQGKTFLQQGRVHLRS